MLRQHLFRGEFQDSMGIAQNENSGPKGEKQVNINKRVTEQQQERDTEI